MKKLPICLLVAAAMPAAAAFKCVDEKGKSYYEDVPPAPCANVVIYEVSPSGTVVRKIEPTTTARPPSAEDGARKAESDRAAIDRQRRDRTLLDTYSSEREIDAARDRSLDLVKARLDSATRQLELVRKRRQQLEAAAGGQKQGAAAKDAEAARAEEASLDHTIASYHAEMDRISKQSETDKVRWRELRQQSGRR